MKDYVKRMIKEHSDLVDKIDLLEGYIYSERSEQDDKVEFANKCVQLRAMRVYENALAARLINAGIEISDGEYFEKIDPRSSIETKEEETNVNGNEPVLD